MKIKYPVLFVLTFLLCLSFNNLQAQIHDIGITKKEDFSSDETALDSSYNAYVIFDIGEIEFETVGSEAVSNVFMRRHCKIKIISDAAAELGNIGIEYRSNPGDFTIKENVSLVKAFTHSLVDGEVVTIPMDASSVFRTKDGVKFALPQVQSGSIIEYYYEYRYPLFYTIAQWDFQCEIPTRLSKFTIDVPEFYSMNIVVTGYEEFKELETSQFYSEQRRVNVTRKKFEVLNSLPLKREDYIHNYSDHVSRIEFQISEYQYKFMKYTESFSKTWDQIINTQMSDRIFELEAKNPKWYVKYLPENYKEYTDLNEQANALVAQVKSMIKSKSGPSDGPTKKIPEIIKAGEGSTGDINFFLLILCRAAGLDAYPAYISPRGYGILKSSYPKPDQIKLMVVAIKNGEDWIFRDASNVHLADNLLTLSAYNSKAIVGVNKKAVFVPISMDNLRLRQVFSTEVDLSGEQGITRKYSIYLDMFESAFLRRKLESSSLEDNIKNMFFKKNFDEKITSLNALQLENRNEPISIEITTLSDAPEGNKVIVPVIGLGKINQNPFTSSVRKAPIDLNYPFTRMILTNYILKPLANTQNSIEPLNLTTSDNAISFIMNTEISENKVSSMSKIVFSKPRLEPSTFGTLKGIYDKIIQSHEDNLFIEFN